jgi:hypothetical protein
MLGCVIFKTFASFGHCDLANSFMAIVKRRFSSPKISSSLSLINSLNYLRENLLPWNIFNSSVNKVNLERFYYCRHTKSGNSSSLKKFELEGLLDNQLFGPRSKVE